MYFILVCGNKRKIGIVFKLGNDNFAHLCITTVNGAVMRLETFGGRGGLNVDGVAAFKVVIAVYATFFMLGGVANRAFVVGSSVVLAVSFGRSGEIPTVIRLDPGFVCNEVSIAATGAIVLCTLGVAFFAATCNGSCNVVVRQRSFIVYNVNVCCIARADVGGIAIGAASGCSSVGTRIVIVCKRIAGFLAKGIVAGRTSVLNGRFLAANSSCVIRIVRIIVCQRYLIFYNVGIIATAARIGEITLKTASSRRSVGAVVHIVTANSFVSNEVGVVAIKARISGKALRIAGCSVGMNAGIHIVSFCLCIFCLKGVGAVCARISGDTLLTACRSSIGSVVFVSFGNHTFSGLYVTADGTGVFGVVAEAAENGLHTRIIRMYFAGGDGRRTGRGQGEVIQTAFVATTPKGAES